MIEKLPHLPTQDELNHGDTAVENRWKINELVEAMNALIEIARIDHRMVKNLGEKYNRWNITALSKNAERLMKYDD